MDNPSVFNSLLEKTIKQNLQLWEVSKSFLDIEEEIKRSLAITKQINLEKQRE